MNPPPADSNDAGATPPPGGRGDAVRDDRVGASARRRRVGERRRRRRAAWRISLNLTPMIDVVFLLLFFFLVASRFRTGEGMLEAQLPARVSGAATAEVPRTPIRVRFLSEPASPERCRVTIDHLAESPMPIAELADVLRRVQDPDRGFDAATPVHLLAGDDVAWDHVVNAYNAAIVAQYEKVYFVSLP